MVICLPSRSGPVPGAPPYDYRAAGKNGFTIACEARHPGAGGGPGPRYSPEGTTVGFSTRVRLMETFPSAEAGVDGEESAEKAATVAAELLKGIGERHPAEYLLLAASLMKAGRSDEAVFWYYAGQLRYRYYYAANRERLEGSEDASLVSALLQSVGPVINAYAFADLSKLRTTIDEVIRWDETTPNGFFAKETDPRAHREVLDGLLKMRQTTIDDAEHIRAERAKNGLPNNR